MDTDSFNVYVKTDDIYKDIREDVETNYELETPLPTGKNKKVIELIKDGSGGQIMEEFVGLRAKTYSDLKYINDEDKKAKGTKQCVIKRKFKFQDYKHCLEAARIKNKISNLEKSDVDILQDFRKNDKLILETQQRFRGEKHNVYTKEINKIVLRSNNDERIQSIDSKETY